MTNISPKVSAAVLTAAIVTLIVYLATFAGIEIPVVAQGALTTVLVGFAGYLRVDPARSTDTVVDGEA